MSMVHIRWRGDGQDGEIDIADHVDEDGDFRVDMPNEYELWLDRDSLRRLGQAMLDIANNNRIDAEK